MYCSIQYNSKFHMALHTFTFTFIGNLEWHCSLYFRCQPGWSLSKDAYLDCQKVQGWHWAWLITVKKMWENISGENQLWSVSADVMWFFPALIMMYQFRNDSCWTPAVVSFMFLHTTRLQTRVIDLICFCFWRIKSNNNKNKDKYPL